MARPTAEAILRSRLEAADSISVRLSSPPARLLTGAVDSVQVSGVGWCTPLRLSCRSVDVRVGRTSLDFPQILSSARILLQSPARGHATIRFSPSDWDGFLAHPLLSKALSAYRRERDAPTVRFKGSTVIEGTGSVRFACAWGAAPMVASLSQRAGEARARVSCEASEKQLEEREEQAEEREPQAEAGMAASFLECFFNDLLVDLDGCQLRFSSMSVVEGSRANEPVLELKLDVCVVRFPSPLTKF
ncbi:MAG: hypothetical protein SGPRY_008878 [Prymnesium sp.]